MVKRIPYSEIEQLAQDRGTQLALAEMRLDMAIKSLEKISRWSFENGVAQEAIRTLKEIKDTYNG